MSKLLFIDLETSPNISYTWHGKHEVDVIEFLEEGYILTFAYKWLGDKKVKSLSIPEAGSKEKLAKRLHQLFDEADIICAHNGNNFDIKWANRAFISFGMNPPSPFKQIDTLLIARNKFNFNSNRLNDLGEYLGLGKKIDTGGFKLWKSCMEGDKKAFKKMSEYNRQDIVLLEKVFLKLAPWHNTPQISETGMACPQCGSTHIQYRGYSTTKTTISRRVQCQKCGKWSVSSVKVKIHSGEYLK